MRKYIGIFLAAVVTVNAAPLIISNMSASHQPDTKLVDVWYAVSNSDTGRVNVSVSFKDGGRVISAFAFTGEACTNRSSERISKITWDAGENHPEDFSALTVTVTADDGHTPGISESCPVTKSAQPVSVRTDRAGKSEPGAAAPDSRFTDHGDGTVLDNRTGLEWMQAPHSLSGNSQTMVWSNAIDFCRGLVYAGHSDWRLPSRTELMSLVDNTRNSPALPAGHPFSDIQNSHYWSSTSHSGGTGFAWYVNMSYGHVSDYYTALSFYVWPVRGE
jgi:hypothetical protein